MQTARSKREGKMPICMKDSGVRTYERKNIV
jgi:hypothetical protein